MVKPVAPDHILVNMPSLRAVRSFVAAAKYQSFTRAAEALCVTQAAISRQIRELESSLGVPLFKRTGRTVELTEAGSIFYDAAYLSFINIAQAAQRLKTTDLSLQEVTICCSPAFSSFWLSHRLPSFFAHHPDINVNVITTQDFWNLEPGIYPDVIISKTSDPRQGYQSEALFYDLIYPVCTPKFLAQHPEITSLDGLRRQTLLNLSPYGRSQIAEHVDWSVWFDALGSTPLAATDERHLFNANDYSMLVQMALDHQGVCLGWHHLVGSLVKRGDLVRVGDMSLSFKEKRHFFTCANESTHTPAFAVFREWFFNQIDQEDTRI